LDAADGHGARWAISIGNITEQFSQFLIAGGSVEFPATNYHQWEWWWSGEGDPLPVRIQDPDTPRRLVFENFSSIFLSFCPLFFGFSETPLPLSSRLTFGGWVSAFPPHSPTFPPPSHGPLGTVMDGQAFGSRIAVDRRVPSGPTHGPLGTGPPVGNAPSPPTQTPITRQPAFLHVYPYPAIAASGCVASDFFPSKRPAGFGRESLTPRKDAQNRKLKLFVFSFCFEFIRQ